MPGHVPGPWRLDASITTLRFRHSGAQSPDEVLAGIAARGARLVHHGPGLAILPAPVIGRCPRGIQIALVRFDGFALSIPFVRSCRGRDARLGRQGPVLRRAARRDAPRVRIDAAERRRMQADGAIHHAHRLADLALVLQHDRKPRVHLGVVGIQEPGLVEAPHCHAGLAFAIKTVSLFDARLRRRPRRSKGLQRLGGPLLVNRPRRRGGAAVTAGVHRRHVGTGLWRLRCLDHAAWQPQQRDQNDGLEGWMHGRDLKWGRCNIPALQADDGYRCAYSPNPCAIHDPGARVDVGKDRTD